MSHDILTGLLPTGNPLAPFDTAAARRATDAADESAADAAAEAAAAPAPDSSPSTGEFPAPVVQSPVARRPRRSVAGPLVAAFAVLLFAAIGVCLYLLVSGTGISPKGGLVAVEPSPGKPAATRPARPIMENSAPRTVGHGAESLPRSILESEPPRSEVGDGDAATGDPLDGGGSSDGAGLVESGGPSDDDSSGDRGEVPEALEPMAGDEANTAVADPAEPQWELVYETLRSGRFAEMPAVTAAAIQQANTPEQRERAARLHRLAELAAQYDEAIRSGADGLGAAEEFELAPDLRVIVVESSRDAISLRLEGRFKTYSLDSVPLVLAHSLARFSLPEGDPVAAAARGAYQALWPQASDAHRRQSFQWWRDLKGSGKAGDAVELEPAVRELFEMPVE